MCAIIMIFTFIYVAGFPTVGEQMSVTDATRLSVGVPGLDAVIHGGLIETRSYMIRGPPGTGKTILGFHFLEAGIEAGETVMFINLEEDLDDLRANARAFGFRTEEIKFLDLSPTADVFVEDRTYGVFSASEVETEPLTDAIIEAVRTVEPDRVVVDPLTQLRYLVADDYQFRKQVIGFMRFLKKQGATVVFTVQDTASLPTDELEFLTDGAFVLERRSSGPSISVPKFRGSKTRGGDHIFRITDEGMVVYPELAPGDHTAQFVDEQISSGVPEIDSLLHGGFARGTVSIISGPTGVGKTTLGTQFMKEAAGRGERSVIFLFEENVSTFIARSKAINVPIEQMIDQGTLQVYEIDGLEYSPQEFSALVREEVEERGAQIVMVDGISGYRLTLDGGDDQLLTHLHALGRYLKNMGTTAIFIDETAEITGRFTATQRNISYLADTIVFLRHLEVHGELRKAIGVLKKRTSDYERTLRAFEITAHGITVGDPLTGMRGILSGTPEVVDADRSEE